jgi:hypothetical protein
LYQGGYLIFVNSTFLGGITEAIVIPDGLSAQSKSFSFNIAGRISNLVAEINEIGSWLQIGDDMVETKIGAEGSLDFAPPPWTG